MDFGSANYRFSDPSLNVTSTQALTQGTKVDIDADVVTARLNKRF